MLSFRQFIVESDTIDYSHYDLHHKYDYFNRTLFDGKLGPCHLSWKPEIIIKRKEAGGLATAEFEQVGGGYRMTPGTLAITLATKFKRTEQQIDSTLIHEMIHALMYTQGRKEEGHGVFFRSWADSITHKTGIKISITDDISDLELVNSEVETVSVVLVKRRDGYYGAFMGGSTFDSPAKLNTLQVDLNRASHVPAGSEVTVMKVQTNLADKYGKVRTTDKMKGLMPQEVASLQQHGQVLSHFVVGNLDPAFALAHEPKTAYVIYSERRAAAPDRIKIYPFVGSMANDPAKIHALAAYKEGYFTDRGKATPEEVAMLKSKYDARLFQTTTGLIERKRWKAWKDPLKAGYYEATVPEYEELLNGARLLWSFGHAL